MARLEGREHKEEVSKNYNMKSIHFDEYYLNIKYSNRYRLIFEKKQNITLVDLCEGLPFQFAEFLMYTRSLSFDQVRNISLILQLTSHFDRINMIVYYK